MCTPEAVSDVASLLIAGIGFDGQAKVPPPLFCVTLPGFANFARPLDDDFEPKVGRS